MDDWTALLTGEHYRDIKRRGLLPASLSLKQEQETAGDIREWYVQPQWWVEQGLTTEFHDFLRAFWHREVVRLHPESGGQWDRVAQDVIWTIKIAAEDAAFFVTHQPLFERLAHHFFGDTPPGAIPPHMHYTEVLMVIDAYRGEEEPLSQPEIIHVLRIINKMRTVLYNLRFASITLQDVRFAPIRHAPPQESRVELIESWRIYTGSHPLDRPQDDLRTLNAIYHIGLCRSLSVGRSGVLADAATPGAREWKPVRPFLGVLQERVRELVRGHKYVLCRVQTEIGVSPETTAVSPETTAVSPEAETRAQRPPVTGEIDMIVDDTAWFFVPGDQPMELQRLDRLVGILLTVHALTVPVTRVGLYQLITGAHQVWTLDDTWHRLQAPQLTAFVQASV